jgi:hypothetical protein
VCAKTVCVCGSGTGSKIDNTVTRQVSVQFRDLLTVNPVIVVGSCTVQHTLSGGRGGQACSGSGWSGSRGGDISLSATLRPPRRVPSDCSWQLHCPA